MLVRRNPARQMILDRWMRPARGRVDRDLPQQSDFPRSSKRLGDRSNRHEERGHPPFLHQPAALNVATNVVVPRFLQRLGGPLTVRVDEPFATNWIRLSPLEPFLRGSVVVCVCACARGSGIRPAAVALAALARARGSGIVEGDSSSSASAAAAGHGHLNAAGGRSAGGEASPLERAHAADGRAAGGRQQRHPNSTSSEEAEKEEEEQTEWQVEEVDQEEIEEKQEQEEEQHEGHYD